MVGSEWGENTARPHNNEFINIRFSNNTVLYADKGYLFLHVDMTDHDKLPGTVTGLPIIAIFSLKKS